MVVLPFLGLSRSSVTFMSFTRGFQTFVVTCPTLRPTLMNGMSSCATILRPTVVMFVFFPTLLRYVTMLCMMFLLFRFALLRLLVTSAIFRTLRSDHKGRSRAINASSMAADQQ